MNKKFTKFMSVILCAVMLLVVLPFSSMAVNKKTPPYVSVDASFANLRKDMKIGQTTYVEIDWCPPTDEPFEIKYYANGECCEVNFIPDDKGGVSGAEVKAVSYGSCFIGFQILDIDGNIMAIDTIEIRILEPVPFTERVELFFEGIIASLSMFGIFSTFLSAGFLSALFPKTSPKVFDTIAGFLLEHLGGK